MPVDKTQFLRGSATHNPPKIKAVYNVSGSHGGGDLNIPLTKTRFLAYTSGVTDENPDVSGVYRKFAVQTGASDAVNVEVEASISGTWVPAPASMSSSGSSLITPGELVFLESPMPGVKIRLVAKAPVAATDFNITVLMTDPVERRDIGRT